MISILTVVGARPQFIKAAAISRAIGKVSDRVRESILHTGQHYDTAMSEVFFEEMGIPRPSFNLDVGSGSHGAQTARMLEGIEQLIIREKPDMVLVYGDTNSTLAGALAAAKLHVPLAHVEAGIRSFNKAMPEEINRITADHCSTLLFCPTTRGIDNLLGEGFKLQEGPFSADRPGLFHSGDVMFDNALHYARIAPERSRILERLSIPAGGFHLVTLHRDHNADHPEVLSSVLRTLGGISRRDDCPVVLPIHPRTLKNLRLHGDGFEKALASDYPLLRIIEPVSFFDMMVLENNCRMIFTDSGGVQKEAYFFGKPVIILRNETEWVEILEEGAGMLTGTDPERINEAFDRFSREAPSDFPAHYGDGQAAGRIIGAITEHCS